MLIEMTDQQALIEEAQSVGSDLLNYQNASDSRLDRQSRDSAKDAAILYQKLLRPVRHDKNYKLIFECWKSHQCQDDLHALEEQTGYVVRLTRLNDKPRTLRDLYMDFSRYVNLFGIVCWPESTFLSELMLTLPVVNTFKLYIQSLKSISAEAFEAKAGFNPQGLCEYLTGETNLLTNRLWQYHFTGLIDRVLNPGCKLDSMLILISKQKGWNKTRFLESLTENKNYAQPYTIEGSNVELYKLIEGKAVVNFDECDAALRGKCAATTKAFLSTTSDKYRPSYGRTVQEYPRCGAFFGTSNNLEIIQDLDGDRRFYPVLLQKPIEVQWYLGNKALFLGYYKWCLEQGFITFPTSTELNELTTIVQTQFQVQPLYQERLSEFLDYLAPKNFCFSTADLIHAVNGLLDGSAKYEKNKIESILEKAGWKNNRAKLSNGSTPAKPKWNTNSYPTLLSRADLKRQFEGWDASN